MVFVLAAMGTAPSAHAMPLEAGDIRIAAGVGPAGSLGASRLATSSGYVLLDLHGSYAFDQSFGVLIDFGVGAAQGTVPLRSRLGVSYHVPGLDDWPIQPFVFGQFSMAQLFGVLGTDLTYLGFRLGGGTDYFLTEQWSLGAAAALDLGTTLGQSPSLYGVVEVVALLTYTFSTAP